MFCDLFNTKLLADFLRNIIVTFASVYVKPFLSK